MTASNSPPRRLMTTKEVAADLHLGLTKVCALVNDGTLRAIKIGKALRIDPETVERVRLNGAATRDKGESR